MMKNRKTYKYLFVLVVMVVVAAGLRNYREFQRGAVLRQRNDREFRRASTIENAFAIRNVETGMGIRVYGSDVENQIRIVHYTCNYWQCMTWQFIQLEENIFLLRNLFTHKNFQPSSLPEPGITLWQQTLDGNTYQRWEFLQQADETYLMRLQGTELYFTATSDENNSDITLMPLQNSAMQQWMLIRQQPIF